MTEWDKFMGALKREVVAGLKHGFFEYSVSSEIIKGKKRRVIFKAGKTHSFVIEPEHLEGA